MLLSNPRYSGNLVFGNIAFMWRVNKLCEMNWFWKVFELTYLIGEVIKYYNKIHTIPGKIFFIASAAVSALGLPPCRQSSNWNNVCLTGLEYDTLPLSTRVMFLTPQPYKHNNCEHVFKSSKGQIGSNQRL